MEPNTNEATAPKRLKTGGKKPIIIIGVIVAVLLAAYVGLCAYANSLDIFYPNTTINGVDVAGLTAEQAAERLRQEIPEETVEFYLPLADETGDGESAPEGDMLYGADPDAVCTYRELGITEELDYEVSAQSAFDAVQGRSSFFCCTYLNRFSCSKQSPPSFFTLMYVAGMIFVTEYFFRILLYFKKTSFIIVP